MAFGVQCYICESSTNSSCGESFKSDLFTPTTCPGDAGTACSVINFLNNLINSLTFLFIELIYLC